MRQPARNFQTIWRYDMEWTTPVIMEICVGLEINCYACAEI